MDYKFREIEKKWQKKWKDSKIYHVKNDSSKPKSYVLDMFPYPSGTGLHVGHPLGYIASDVYSRYKRLKGFNVLHPMGFDAFGLPAEQYAIETGQHPATTTDNNIETFKKQMDNIGFCFDWSREVRTSEPNYYHWTQWIFLKLFNSWYNRQEKQAQSIDTLVQLFEKEGNKNHECPGDEQHKFTSEQWKSLNEKTQQDILMNYRLAYSGVGEVNWCEALGTVLANDEVVNGVSERGGHPVIKKKLRQWYLRITEYADRLLEGLKSVDFSEAMKEMQSNWIGRSEGVDIKFNIKNHEENMVVYTTRPDTIFGVDFMVLAPEHELINQIKTKEEENKVDQYVAYARGRSERERIAEKKITGCFTGSYAINPLNGKEIPIWISEYVLSGYGTGAVMAVPCGDERDHRFAKHFNIPITNIIGSYYNGEEANPTKDATLQNSEFLNGIKMEDALPLISDKIEEKGLGQRKINFKMRDASFSRQRYWGEPFPIKWKNGNAYALDEKDLPLELPHVETYQPGPEGEGPLANISDWTSKNLETNTMPGYAGSSWYFLRYMDPHNNQEFASKEATEYWNQVDVYVGGTEHAVGHLLYSRLWTKVLFDLGYINFEEPFKKLINQGKITGDSRLVYRIHGTNKFVSKGLKNDYKTDPLHVNVNFVDGFELDTEAFKSWKPEFKDAEFILEDGKYICDSAIEKMSKSLYNTVNPDAVVEEYGADTFRMYEMFLGPIEQSKPWDTKGIEGVSRFLKKLWRLFYDREEWIVNNEKATEAELRILHKTIKKITEDSENFSFNTAVSQFMICVNELTSLKSHKKEILEPLIISLTPYAPHISEELWHLLGHEDSILNTDFPIYDEKYLKESTVTYPIAINGKTRLTLSFDAEADKETIKATVLDNEVVEKWIEGKNIRKFILVPGRMINVVV
ncbi:MAG TPA: leucine--tRNA ligase [Chitinophagaceae bacterium]|nr:leucine--tRNA ligase [Chitinophagaceae bacterium]